MGVYADWADYNETYLLGREPPICEAEFPFWERRARTYIDLATFNRLKDGETLDKHKEAVILCACELAEYYSADAVQEAKGLTSHSVSGQSKGYDKSGKEEREIVIRNLGVSGLLFRGV